MKKKNKKSKENNEKRRSLVDPYSHPTFEDLMESVGMSPTGAVRSSESLRKEAEKKFGHTPPVQSKLKYLEKERNCYLAEGNKEIEIAQINRRQCKLLKCLFNPFGIAKTIDIVFGDIQLPKDKINQSVWSDYTGRRQKESIIRGTGKEIQRTLSQKKSKTSLIFHIKEGRCWIEEN